MTVKEKAERYDALQAAIEFYRKQFSVNRSYANTESTGVGAVGDFYRGKKYAYDEILEVLENWAISLPKAAVTQRKRNAAIEIAIDALKYSELPNSSDLISRQAAIDAIEFGITYVRAINKETGEVKELFQEGNNELRKAAERVNGLPSAQPEPCEDAVSRKYLLEEYDRQHKGEPGGARRIIENAPSVTPKPKTGKWEDISPEYHMGMGIVYRCSACKEYYTTTPREMHYCPNCMAKMEG